MAPARPLSLLFFFYLGADAARRIGVASGQNTSALVAQKRLLSSGSKCANWYKDFHPHAAACVISKDNNVLLITDDQSGSAGWDLPGGESKNSFEASCETAERRACDESTHKVEAIMRLSTTVYLCNIVQENACSGANSKDRNLKRQWFSASELSSLKFRAGTWGEKEKLLKIALTEQLNGKDSNGDTKRFRKDNHEKGIEKVWEQVLAYFGRKKNGQKLDSKPAAEPKSTPAELGAATTAAPAAAQKGRNNGKGKGGRSSKEGRGKGAGRGQA